MAKKRERAVPLVYGQSPILKLDDFDWKRVESAYGQSLSRKQRERIFEATQTYVAFRTRENASEPLRDSVRRIERLKKSAESFHTTLVEGNNGSMANVFAHHEIELQFSDDDLVAPNRLVGLTRVVGSFVSACQTVLQNHLDNEKHLNSMGAKAVPTLDGTAWRNWVVELTRIANEFGLPSGARTDTDKNKGGPSPFVRLVGELQAQLPKALKHRRLPEGGLSALARAINRARKDSRRDKSKAISDTKTFRQD